MQLEVSILIAFGAGVLSFFSPCILPLVPGYLSFLASTPPDQLTGGGSAIARRVLGAALLFVLGFTVVFVLLGTVGGAAGGFWSERIWLSRAAGLFLMGAGLVMADVLPLPNFLLRERRFQPSVAPFGPTGRFLLGAAFALGWTPCIGPILGAILIQAGAAGGALQGAFLLLVYASGLAVPFLLTALFYGRAVSLLRWTLRHYSVFRWIGGLVLVAMGILLLTDRMFLVTLYLQRFIPAP